MRIYWLTGFRTTQLRLGQPYVYVIVLEVLILFSSLDRSHSAEMRPYLSNATTTHSPRDVPRIGIVSRKVKKREMRIRMFQAKEITFGFPVALDREFVV